MDRAAPEVEALLFDVFGTLVDWRGTIVRAAESLGRAHGVSADWEALAHTWHTEGYQDGMARVRQGELPWTSVATLHRRALDDLLPRYGLNGLRQDEVDHFARVWRRLDPWPDVADGLAQLKMRYIIAPLSNGDFDMLVDLARHAGFPWDGVFAAELFGTYKPDPAVYQGAVRLLRLAPERVMLVASHAHDLRAARDEGLRTAYVHRAREYAEGRSPEPAQTDLSFDLVVDDLLELATQLRA